MRCLTRPRRWSALPLSSATTSRAAFAKDLLGHLERRAGALRQTVRGRSDRTAKLPAADYGAGADDPRLLEHLAALGFKKPIVVAGDRAAVDRPATIARSASRRRASAFVEFVPA